MRRATRYRVVVVTRLLVGPFNRVEGDMEVTLDTAGDVVQAAYVNSPLYRGFEQILHGKDPRDALVITPRICGICSVSQSAASAAALRDWTGSEVPANGQLAINLIHAVENLADHLSHFYLFFMPDFARSVYADQSWHGEIAARFQAGTGSALAQMLPVRAQFMHILGYLAGKWPHTLAVQPGGTSRAIGASEKLRIRVLLREFRGFLEATVFGDALEEVTALKDGAALADWQHAPAGGIGDFRRFLAVADALGLEGLGRSDVPFLSYGSYETDGERLLKRGVWAGELRPLDESGISEDISHTWLAGDERPRHPRLGVTLPVMDKDRAYSWCKAPRLAGEVVETGALARQVVDGHPLIRDLVALGGGNVRSRVIARLLEVARIVPEMERWIEAIRPRKPFCASAPLPEEGEGAGLVEAARGSLGHWMSVRQGRLTNYQIIAPTTWNFSPRDGAGVPGVLEQALVGAPVRPGEDTPVAVQHIVRSFDPCMVCTVH